MGADGNIQNSSKLEELNLPTIREGNVQDFLENPINF